MMTQRCWRWDMPNARMFTVIYGLWHGLIVRVVYDGDNWHDGADVDSIEGFFNLGSSV